MLNSSLHILYLNPFCRIWPQIQSRSCWLMSAWPCLCLWAVCVFTVNFGAKGKLAGVGPDVNPSYAVKIYTTLRYASFWDFSILALSKVVKISVNYPLWHHGLNWQGFIWTWAQQITRPVCVGSCFSSECRYSECICVCVYIRLYQVKMEKEQYQTEIRDLQDQLSEMHDELDGAKQSQTDSTDKEAMMEVQH